MAARGRRPRNTPATSPPSPTSAYATCGAASAARAAAPASGATEKSVFAAESFSAPTRALGAATKAEAVYAQRSTATSARGAMLPVIELTIVEDIPRNVPARTEMAQGQTPQSSSALESSR